jgi:hypothetical protein
MLRADSPRRSRLFEIILAMSGSEDDLHNLKMQPPLREYVGYIWIGDEPKVRLSLSAHSLDEARALVEAEHGEGHIVSLWNEDDASKPR